MRPKFFVHDLFTIEMKRGREEGLKEKGNSNIYMPCGIIGNFVSKILGIYKGIRVIITREKAFHFVRNFKTSRLFLIRV